MVKWFKKAFGFHFKFLITAFTKAMAFFLLSQKVRTLSPFLPVVKSVMVNPIRLKVNTRNVLQDLLLVLKINKRTYIAHEKRKVSSDKVVMCIEYESTTAS